MSKLSPRSLLILCFLTLALVSGVPSGAQVPRNSDEVHLGDLRQLTGGGENAEAYWSPDGRELIFQAHGAAEECDQIYRMPADGSGAPTRVSNGLGRTTCSYYLLDGKRVIFASTHAASPACPPPPDRSHGYVWAIYPTYEIWSANPDGSAPVRLTDNQAYDAEATICPKDGSILFTSDRDGDLELYRMDPDGGNVVRLTHTPGYDGGAYFSPDCTKIVWRASRPKPGPELDDFKKLLAQGLVRPSQLEVWVAKADGSDAHQVTHLGAASFGPSFFPSGERIIFSSNYGDPKGREFDLFAIDVAGTNLERITTTPGFDGFPMFSPDGTRLAFSSNRVQKDPGDTNVFVARWLDAPAARPEAATAAADRYAADVRWLADDAREGRGVGTRGLAQAADWIEARMKALGLEPGGVDGGYRLPFPVTVEISSGAGTRLALDGAVLPAEAYRPLAFSTSGSSTGETIAVGYGITAPEQGIDDYAGLDAKGKIAVVRRFVPASLAGKGDEVERKLSDLRYKAWNAREHGAIALLVVDAPGDLKPAEPAGLAAVKPAEPAGLAAVKPAEVGQEPADHSASQEPAKPPAEAPLPALSVAEIGDAGIPVVAVRRAEGTALFERAHRVEVAVALTTRTEPAADIVGVLRAGAEERQAGSVLVGAHYDHLGLGGFGSLDPDTKAPHNGADDNASGTAAVLEAARTLAGERESLRRDVWFVAFSGEERGVLGSTAFIRTPPPGLALGDLSAMINLDMVGRVRDNQLTILGGESALGWKELVDPACARAQLSCSLGGDGYGPSDHSPFYAAGVPVLHLFSGTHSDYHRPSDDADRINAAGGAQVAGLVVDLTESLANRPERMVYKASPAPPPAGDVRSSGASLGTIPDYAGDQRPGVLLGGVRAGSPAEKAGLRRGDLLVELAGTEIRDINDFMFVLRRAEPGQRAPLVFVRDGRKQTVEVTFGVNTRLR